MPIPPVSSPEASLKALRMISESSSLELGDDVGSVLELMASAFSKYDLGPCWNQDSLRCMIQLWRKYLNPKACPMQMTEEVRKELESFVQREGFPFAKRRLKSLHSKVIFKTIMRKHEASQVKAHHMINIILGEKAGGYCLGLALKKGLNFILGANIGIYPKLVEMYELCPSNARERCSRALGEELSEIRDFQERDFACIDSIPEVGHRWIILNSSHEEMKAFLEEIQNLYGSEVYMLFRSGAHAIGLYFLEGNLCIFNQNSIGLEERIYRVDAWIEYLYKALYCEPVRRRSRFICVIDLLYRSSIQDKVDIFFQQKELFPKNSVRFYERCSVTGYSAYLHLMCEDSCQVYFTQAMYWKQPKRMWKDVLPSNGWTVFMIALKYQRMLPLDVVSCFIEKSSSTCMHNNLGKDILKLACRFQKN